MATVRATMRIYSGIRMAMCYSRHLPVVVREAPFRKWQQQKKLPEGTVN